jgi:hypothetical protein
VSVGSWLGPGRQGRVDLLVQVSGVPSGQQVQLSVSGGADLQAQRGSCQPSGGGFACTATPGHRFFTFDVDSHSASVVTFTITPPSGWTDPDPGNNSSTVQVPGAGDGGQGGQGGRGRAHGVGVLPARP